LSTSRFFAQKLGPGAKGKLGVYFYNENYYDPEEEKFEIVGTNVGEIIELSKLSDDRILVLGKTRVLGSKPIRYQLILNELDLSLESDQRIMFE
jgi:hypothetical protein